MSDSSNPSVEVEIRARLDQFERGLARARQGLAALDSSFSGSTQGAQNLEVGSTKAAQTISSRLTTSLQGAIDAQTQFVKQLGATTYAVGAVKQEMSSLTAVNDNASSSFSDTYKEMQQAKAGLIGIASATLNVVGELKLLALAAYALIPAFRGITNMAAKEVVSALGLVAPTAATAAAAIIRSLGPALAFLSRITPPILLAVAAYKVLADVVSTGSTLLGKYGSAQRDLVADVDKNLEKLTRFQEATMSAEQVRQATELGARLTEANRTISQFLNTQLNLTSPALMLQGAWVVIAESIASAVDALNRMPPWAVRAIVGGAGGGLAGATIGSVVPGVGTLLGGTAGAIAGGITGVMNPPAEETAQSIEDAMRVARERLAAGMGSTANFAVRFGQAISDLASPVATLKSETSAAAGEFARLTSSMERSAAATEADIAAIGKSAGEHAALRAQMRLTEAAQQEIAQNGGSLDDYAKRIDALVDRIRLGTQALAEMKLASDVAFEGRTALLSSADQQIAGRLRGVYGDQWQSQMSSAIAQQMRFNDALKQSQQLATEFAQGFISDLRQGVQLGEALGNAMNRLADRLIQMAVDQSINALLRGLTGALGGGGGAAFGGYNTTGLFGAADGAVFRAGNVIPFARGGVVGGPTLFPMASGAGLMGEAGPEAVMPLRRLPSGRLGVEAATSAGAASGPVSVSFAIDARGAERGAGDEIARTMAEFVRTPQFKARVNEAVREAQSRRM